MPPRIVSIILLCCVVCSTTSARAEEEAGPLQVQVSVAVIDVAKVLGYASQSQVAELRAELSAARKRFQEEQDSLIRRREKLVRYKLSSADHMKLKREVLRVQGESEADWQVAREQFLLERAKVYRESYQAMHVETKTFMTEHELDLVLRTKTPRPETWLPGDDTLVDLLSLPSPREPTLGTRGIRNLSVEERIEQVRLLIEQPVVAAGRIDITGAILQRLLKLRKRKPNRKVSRQPPRSN